MHAMQSTAEREMITVGEAAERSRYSHSYVRSLVGCGKLLASRRGRRIYIDASSLAIILRARAARRRRAQIRLVVDNT